MRFGACLVLCCPLLASAFALAQARGNGGMRSSVALGVPDIKMGTSAGIQPSETFFISGKVVIEDGSALTDRAAIQTICHDQRHTEAYTDQTGFFSFELGKPNGIIGEDPEDTSTSNPGKRLNRNLNDCELQATLPGFSSSVVQLVRFDGAEASDVGTITLHRLAQVEGFSISATTAAAPSNARKDYEKGRNLEAKQNWNKAREKFEKAVTEYPNFAIAWLELGKVQVREQDLMGARQSFDQAIHADAKLIGPYQELARIAMQQKNWNEAVSYTDRLLTLNPVSFPQDWLFNALGNYFLQKFEVAEKSVRQGLKADADHHLSSLEYLLGLVLIQRHNYAEALDHLRSFAKLSPNSPTLDTVNRQIAALEALQPRTPSGQASLRAAH